MIQVIRRKRKSAVLTPSSLSCLAHMPTVNLTAGCAHGCLYCYTRGYRTYPGEGKIILYENLLDRLQTELKRKRKKPQAVYFSPSSDLFQPLPEVLELGYAVILFLLENRVGVSFLTKGVIPEKHFQLIAEHSDHVSAGIGIISLSERVTSVFEPQAAQPALRLDNMRKLIRLGVNTQARIDPMLPGVTDSEDALRNLLSAIADTGVKQVAVSALFLRPAVKNYLQRQRNKSELIGRVLEQFQSGLRMPIHAGVSGVIALPETDRRAMYDLIQALCEKLGLEMKCCACKNPDITTGSCSIAGKFAARFLSPEIQAKLFPEQDSEEE